MNVSSHDATLPSSGLFGRLLTKYDFQPTPLERCKYRSALREISNGYCGCVCCNPDEYQSILGRKLFPCYGCSCCLGVEDASLDPFYNHPCLAREVDVFGTVHLYLNCDDGCIVQQYKHHPRPVRIDIPGDRPAAITHHESLQVLENSGCEENKSPSSEDLGFIDDSNDFGISYPWIDSIELDSFDRSCPVLLPEIIPQKRCARISISDKHRNLLEQKCRAHLAFVRLAIHPTHYGSVVSALHHFFASANNM